MKLLAIDLGASGGRALVGTLTDGARGRLEMEEVHRFAHGPVPVPRDGGHTYHWDPVGQWEAVLAGMRKAARSHGQPESVGVDTWGVDFALLARRGELAGTPVAYRDARTEGMAERACAAVGREELFRRTGLQFMYFNSLFQLMALRHHDSPQLRIADRLLFIPDLFHYWLSGEKVAEYTIASTSQMIGAADRQWDRELLRRLELPDGILPELCEPGTVLGPLRASVAEETGLGTGVRVICPAGHDTGSAVVATPGEGDDWAFLSTGTWCLFGAELPQPYLSPSVLDAGFGNEGGVRGTTRLLRNITGLWLVQESRRYWEERGESYSYAELARLALEARPFAAVIDPDDPVFAPPSRMPETIANYCARTGQSAPESVGECVRVCLEGIALAVRHRWEQLEGILGRKLGALNAVGGGTQNTLLCQLIADALGKPVLAGPVEATAMGNALVQAVGLGALDFTEARAVVRRSVELVEYRPRETGPVEEAYSRFLTLAG